MPFDLLVDFFRHYLFSDRAGAVVKRISWLSVIGLFVSVSVFILVMSVMTALNSSMKARTLAIEPHLTVEFPPGTDFAILEAHPLTAKVKELQASAQVDPFEMQDVILRTMDGHFHGAIARGVSEKSYRHLLTSIQKLNKATHGQINIEALDGPLISEVDLGVDLARSLGAFEGDYIMVVPPEGLLLPPSESPPFERVKVRRILSTNLADIDANVMFYRKGLSLNNLKDTASRRNGLEIWLDQPDEAMELKNKLVNFPEFRIETWQERNSALFFALRLEKSAIMIFLGMAALVAAFSLITVLTLLTNQKRREIGLLRALGFSGEQIRILFSRLGYGLAIAGGGSGLIVGILCSLYLEKFPLNVLPDIYYDSEIPAQLDGWTTLLVSLAGVALVLWGSRAAANQAVSENISNSLRQNVIR